MLSSLKRTISTSLVQFDELTAINEKKWKQRARKSVDNIRVGVSHLSSFVTSDSNSKHKKPVIFNLPSAVEQLLKYETEWIQLHAENVDIAHNAAVADRQIQRIFRQCEDQKLLMDRFYTQVKLIPELTQSINKAASHLDDIVKRLEELEVLLDEVEQLEEKEKFDRWVDAQIESADLYANNRRREVKAREANLEKQAAEEKQRQLEIEFEKQMEEFRNERKPRSTSVISNKSIHEEQEELAKVEPEEELEDKAALSEFLETETESSATLSHIDESLSNLETPEQPEPVVTTTEESPETPAA